MISAALINISLDCSILQYWRGWNEEVGKAVFMAVGFRHFDDRGGCRVPQRDLGLSFESTDDSHFNWVNILFF